MTDEEMAEEYVREHTGFNVKEPLGKIAVRTYLAGLKAGRPKWHDLQKNPKDVPDTTRLVVVKYEGVEREDVDNFDGSYGWFSVVEGYSDYDPIAWCEIPKYTEE